MLELTAARVQELFDECLAAQPDSHTSVTVEGVVHTVALDRSKLSDYHDVIGDLLYQLPSAFQPVERGGGGGMSFLNACMDRNKNQWTGMHLVMEQATVHPGYRHRPGFLMPKDMWDMLPGSMPYIAVNPDRKSQVKIGE